MNILFGCHGYPPDQTGGGELRTHRTAQKLQQRGHTVQVLSINNKNIPTNEKIIFTDDEFDDIRVRRLSLNLRQSFGYQSEYNNQLVHRELLNLFEDNLIDIFHLFSGFRITGSGVIAARGMGIPVVISLTDYWFLCPRITLRRKTGELCRIPADPMDCTICLLNEKRRYRLPYTITHGSLYALLKRYWRKSRFLGFKYARSLNEWIILRREFQQLILQEANKVIAPSKFLADIYLSKGVNGNRFEELRQGVDIKSPRVIEKSRNSNCGITFGFVGSIAVHKGLDILLEAFRNLKNYKLCKLLIFSNPNYAWSSYFRSIEFLINKDERISFMGYVSNNEAWKIYNSIDVLVMPSIWYENSPNVILESFAYKIPVVASNIGGMAELVSNEVNGLLFECGNVDDLTKQMRRMIDEPDLLKKLISGIPPVKTVAKEIDELEKIYTELEMKRTLIKGK